MFQTSMSPLNQHVNCLFHTSYCAFKGHSFTAFWNQLFGMTFDVDGKTRK